MKLLPLLAALSLHRCVNALPVPTFGLQDINQNGKGLKDTEKPVPGSTLLPSFEKPEKSTVLLQDCRVFGITFSQEDKQLAVSFKNLSKPPLVITIRNPNSKPICVVQEHGKGNCSYSDGILQIHDTQSGNYTISLLYDTTIQCNLAFKRSAQGFPGDPCRNVSKGTNVTLFPVPKPDGFVLIKHDLTMKFEILDGEPTKSCSKCVYRDGWAILTDVKPEDAGIYHLEHMDHEKTSVCLNVIPADGVEEVPPKVIAIVSAVIIIIVIIVIIIIIIIVIYRCRNRCLNLITRCKNRLHKESNIQDQNNEYQRASTCDTV